jgi:hypothetical protein
VLPPPTTPTRERADGKGKEERVLERLLLPAESLSLPPKDRFGARLEPRFDGEEEPFLDPKPPRSSGEGLLPGLAFLFASSGQSTSGEDDLLRERKKNP